MLDTTDHNCHDYKTFFSSLLMLLINKLVFCPSKLIWPSIMFYLTRASVTKKKGFMLFYNQVSKLYELFSAIATLDKKARVFLLGKYFDPYFFASKATEVPRI